MRISLVFTGRAYHRAADLPASVDLPEGATLADAIRSLRQQLPADGALPASCLVALDGEHLGTLAAAAQPPLANRPLQDGQELLLLAPVAGG